MPDQPDPIGAMIDGLAYLNPADRLKQVVLMYRWLHDENWNGMANPCKGPRCPCRVCDAAENALASLARDSRQSKPH